MLSFAVLGAFSARAVAAPLGYSITQIPGVGLRDFVNGFNNNGQVVGTTLNTSTDQYNVFVYSNGVTTNIGPQLSATQSVAYAINDSGEVIGTFVDSSGLQSGFLYSGGIEQSLGVGAYPASINSQGQVLFNKIDALGNSQAFIYQNGASTQLGTISNSYQVFPTLINNRGQLAGGVSLPSGYAQAFLYDNGTFTVEGSLNGTYSQALSLNNNGQLAGNSIGAAGFSQAILITGGVMQDLGTISGGLASWATSVNDSGEVVGYSTTPPDGFDHAFVYLDGQMYDLNGVASGLPSGYFFDEAYAVNNNGEILASAYDPTTGGFQYDVLQPLLAAPEPGSGLLLSLGVGLIVSCVRGRISRSCHPNHQSESS